MQHAGAIDDGVDPGQPGPPGLGAGVAVEVHAQGLDTRPLAAESRRIANGSHHVVAACPKAGQKLAAYKSVRTCQQNSHGGSLAKPRRSGAAGGMAIHGGSG
jgi:hypothetical protein